MKTNAIEHLKTAHIQAHHYPSRREIIEKCESGSFHPILTNKGRGRNIAEMKATDKAFGEGIERIFGKKPLNIAPKELLDEFDRDRGISIKEPHARRD